MKALKEYEELPEFIELQNETKPSSKHTINPSSF
jgi:hypothetical protein